MGQKKEKLKGSKIVTIEKKEVQDFDGLEVQDGLEISLIKGDKNGVELEADDNLQKAIGLNWNGSTLIIKAIQEIASFKKFNIRVTYTDSFKTLVSKDKANIKALEEIKLEAISIKSFDNSKMFLNLSVKTFSVEANDKSEIQMNSKAEKATLVLSKNATLKALIAATEMKCDLYQKSRANIEGDVVDMTVRLDNNTNYTAKKLTAQNLDLSIEGYANANVYAEKSLILNASGTTELELYGNPKIDLKQFSDGAILYKKTLQ
jgi:hypothetical protein